MEQKHGASGEQGREEKKYPIGRQGPSETKSDKDDDTGFARVTGIAEILELILLHLDPKSLLTCLSVSLHFRATIEGSLRLRRALFLAPDKRGTWWIVNRLDRTVRTSKFGSDYFFIGQDHIRAGIPMKANPLLLSHLELTLQHNSLYGQLFDRHETDKKYTGLILLRGIPRHTGPSNADSCRHMLLTQPPCHAVTIYYRAGLRPWKIRLISKTHALTFGELTDEWRAYSGGWPLSIQLQAERSMRILPEGGIFASEAEQEAVESAETCHAPIFRDWRDYRTVEWHGESVGPDRDRHERTLLPSSGITGR